MNTTVSPQPRYSPDLATANFFLFPKLKTTFKEQQTIQQITENSQMELCEIPKKSHTRTISRSGNGVWSSASMQERSTLKVIQLSVAGMSKKNYKKIAPKLFEKTMYSNCRRKFSSSTNVSFLYRGQ
jgi:hypothetical protein